MKKGDILVIVILFMIVIVSFLAVNTPKESYTDLKAIIKIDGELYKEIKLKDNYNNYIEINSEFGYNKISIDGNKVKMLEADCEDKLCMRENEISKPFQSLICLPNRLIVYIEGDTELNYVSY